MSRREFAKSDDGALQLRGRDRFFPQHASRAVAPTDAQLHPAARNQIESRKKTRGNRKVAHRWISHAWPQPHLPRRVRHQSKQRIGLFPQYVGVKNPAILESRFFRLPSQRDDTLHGNIRFEGDAELHAFLFSSVAAFSASKTTPPVCRIEYITLLLVPTGLWQHRGLANGVRPHHYRRHRGHGRGHLSG